MHRLMKNDPNRFAGEPHTPNPNAYVNDGLDDEVMDPHARRNGHLPEDWNRVHWLLTACERCTGRAVSSVVHAICSQLKATELPSSPRSRAPERP